MVTSWLEDVFVGSVRLDGVVHHEGDEFELEDE